MVVSGGTGGAYELDVRAYNDGGALRARLPAKTGRRISGESTEWKLAGNPLAWYQTDFGSYEGIFQSTRLDDLSSGQRIPLPITFSLPAGGFALVTEANLVNYSDLGVQVAADHALRAYFHASQKGWTTDDAVVQPWRVTLLARDLNALVNSDLVRNLCPPSSPELAKAQWIQPGRSTWQWWSSGAPRYSEQHQWVDWTKQLGFEYYLVDDGWKGWRDNGRDAWACLREVCDYAKTQGVKVWAWVHSNEVATAATRTAFFDRAVAAGVAGVKIDFEPQADVRWATWYDESLRDAAARKLLLDFHGANKPVGRDRTWPNESDPRVDPRPRVPHSALPPHAAPAARLHFAVHAFCDRTGRLHADRLQPSRVARLHLGPRVGPGGDLHLAFPLLCRPPPELLEELRAGRIKGDSRDLGRDARPAGQ